MKITKEELKKINKAEEELENLKVDLKQIQTKKHLQDLKFIDFLEKFQRHERDFWTMVAAILEEDKKK